MAAKKSTKRSSTKKRKTTIKTPAKEDNVQKVLIENFVAFQRVMADMTAKLNSLNDQLSKLLGLFEESAKSLMDKNANLGDMGSSKEVSEKLNKLLEQNKVLAQGIALLHEANPEPGEGEPEEPKQPMPPGAMQGNPAQRSINKYQKSISSKY